MEVGRSFSFLNGWFVGSMLIFHGVYWINTWMQQTCSTVFVVLILCPKKIAQVSKRQPQFRSVSLFGAQSISESADFFAFPRGCSQPLKISLAARCILWVSHGRLFLCHLWHAQVSEGGNQWNSLRFFVGGRVVGMGAHEMHLKMSAIDNYIPEN